MRQDSDWNDQMITLTSTEEDGQTSEADFRVIAVYEADGREYIAMTPDLDAPELEADIYLFRFLGDGEAFNVEEIESDEEFAAAADAFQAWQLSRDEQEEQP
ncbi:MAG: DUF1292 domain-containing protein [Candidatus Avoscillospira sp.]